MDAKRVKLLALLGLLSTSILLGIGQVAGDSEHNTTEYNGCVFVYGNDTTYVFIVVNESISAVNMTVEGNSTIIEMTLFNNFTLGNVTYMTYGTQVVGLLTSQTITWYLYPSNVSVETSADDFFASVEIDTDINVTNENYWFAEWADSIVIYFEDSTTEAVLITIIVIVAAIAIGLGIATVTKDANRSNKRREL